MHQTVERCLRRAERLGVIAALDDSPRPGREPVITDEARTLVVDLACRKAKDCSYPHELWTTRLLAKHIREHGPIAGHEWLGRPAPDEPAPQRASSLLLLGLNVVKSSEKGNFRFGVEPLHFRTEGEGSKVRRNLVVAAPSGEGPFTT
jgi:hypothetical protein